MTKLHQNILLKTTTGKVFKLSGSRHNCPVCGSNKKNRVRYSFADFSLVDCSTCATTHLSPLPSTELISEIYNNNYYNDSNLEHGYLDYATEAGRIRRTYNRRLKFVKSYLHESANPTILEIGAALGFGLSETRDLLNAKVIACDISKEAVNACKKSGFRAHVTDAYGTCESIEPHSIDMVIAFDLIEHLPDIRRFTEWLELVLKPGGLFFITTPNMNHVLNKILRSRSPSIKIPQHIIYFTTETLRNALERGFTLESCAWDYQYVGLGMFCSRLAHILGLPLLRHEFGPTIIVPNGMCMYVFRRGIK